MKKNQHRVNKYIKAKEVKLISENGKMMGTFSLQSALDIARERDLDLIEIGSQSSPPICKIMDYGKWKYEKKKKASQNKKKQVTIIVKEIQVRPRTDQHDLDVKLRHARRFLIDGNKVKINLRFSGREMAHQDLGVNLLDRMTGSLEDLAIIEQAPKKEGRHIFVLLSPDPVKVKSVKSKNKKSS